MENSEAGGILSGLTIKEMVRTGKIEIDPWNPTHLVHEDRVNPASYDLTLGDEVAVYDSVVTGEFNLPEDKPPGFYLYPARGGYLDVRRKNAVRRHRMDPELGFLLKPGIGYLMHTAERIRSDGFVPILDGKSSVGRLFTAVHVTAGYGDPGFNGQFTLEVVVTHPVIVVPGMRCCQVRFHTLVGEAELYGRNSSYQGIPHMGVVESRSWKMFPQAAE